MRLDEMLCHVEKEYHLDFIELLQTGLAVSNYMDHMEFCSGCKHALHLAAKDRRGIFRLHGLHGSKADNISYLDDDHGL
jgi:hypothetical protein